MAVIDIMYIQGFSAMQCGRYCASIPVIMANTIGQYPRPSISSRANPTATMELEILRSHMCLCCCGTCCCRHLLHKRMVAIAQKANYNDKPNRDVHPMLFAHGCFILMVRLPRIITINILPQTGH